MLVLLQFIFTITRRLTLTMNQARPTINYHDPTTDSHLEVLTRFPAQPSAKPPLLFVHGSFISAWCWEVHFMPYFARHGYPCYALSLRGHGGSSGHERLHWHGLDDYVDDLAQVAEGLERPPVLIGHSMGGLIVQHYLQRAASPGAVLLASVPPQGLLPMAWWVMLTRPWLLQEIHWVQLGLAQFSNYREISRTLFSDNLPEALALDYLSRTQPESQRALWEMSGPGLSWPSTLNGTPALVLGAGQDALVPPFAVHATALALAVQAEWFSDTAHIMMLEAEWEQPAGRILTWLSQLE